MAAIEPIIAHSRHELGGDAVPLIIAGHSLGAEIAIWTAAYTCEPKSRACWRCHRAREAISASR